MKIFKCVGEVIVLIILFLMLIPIAILEEILSRKKVTSPSHSPLMVGGGTKICDKCCRLPSQCICNKKKGTDK